MNSITAVTNSCRYGKFNHRHTMCVITAPTNPHPGAIYISPRDRGTLGDPLESGSAFIGSPVCMQHKMPMSASSARDHVYEACFDCGYSVKPRTLACNKTANYGARSVPAEDAQPSTSIVTRAHRHGAHPVSYTHLRAHETG